MEESNNLEPKQEQATVLYSWQSLEFSRTASKSPMWYLGAGAVWVGLMVYAIYLKDWIRLAMAALLGVVIWLVVRMRPREFAHEITTAGITVGGKSYSYSKFKSFSIVTSDGEGRLIVLPAQRFGQGLSLQLGGADVERVRSAIARFLPEQAGEEDLIDRMNRFFRL